MLWRVRPGSRSRTGQVRRILLCECVHRRATHRWGEPRDTACIPHRRQLSPVHQSPGRGNDLQHR